MKVITAESSKVPLSDALTGWWKGLAYRNKATEWALYFMFLSGILLWDQIVIPWPLERMLLVIHVLSSLVLFPITVLPFWLSHRKLLHSSNKKLLKITGLLLDYLLLGCALSGVFLVLEGNRGDDFGWFVYMAHLISAFVILPLLIRHTAKWSVLKPVWSIFLRNNKV